MNTQSSQSINVEQINQLNAAMHSGQHEQSFSDAEMLHFNPFAQNNHDKNALIRFPTERRISHKRWICNISEHFRFVENKGAYLQVVPSATHTQFNLLCRLLKLGHCAVIYFDCNFTENELIEIRQLQKVSGTELVNSKQAFLLSISQYSIYA